MKKTIAYTPGASHPEALQAACAARADDERPRLVAAWGEERLRFAEAVEFYVSPPFFGKMILDETQRAAESYFTARCQLTRIGELVRKAAEHNRWLEGSPFNRKEAHRAREALLALAQAHRTADETLAGLEANASVPFADVECLGLDEKQKARIKQREEKFKRLGFRNLLPTLAREVLARDPRFPRSPTEWARFAILCRLQEPVVTTSQLERRRQQWKAILNRVGRRAGSTGTSRNKRR